MVVSSQRSAWLSSTRYLTFIFASWLEAQTNRPTSQKSDDVRRPGPQGFTEKQGQYLASIYVYSHMFRRPPAETDMQRHFRVSPPSVHQMIINLDRAGLIRRQPGVARSIEILVAPEDLPILEWLEINPSKSL
jgi:DNA-binding MarR family transcriptional regulator